MEGINGFDNNNTYNKKKLNLSVKEKYIYFKCMCEHNIHIRKITSFISFLSSQAVVTLALEDQMDTILVSVMARATDTTNVVDMSS